MTARPHITLEPRLLSADDAAAYCGLSAPTFRSECPVIPIKIRSRVLYDKKEIDRWIDTKAAANPELPRGNEWLKRLEDAHAAEGH